MKIRNAQINELDKIMEIYAIAREYMKQNGNEKQWGDNYPAVETIKNDIENKQCFVGVDDQNIIHFVFVFIIGEDSTYKIIEQGKWLNDDTYGTIHRLASDGLVKGIFSNCLEFCLEKISNIRADTHHDNLTMQHLFEKNQFEKCGIIYVEDGTPRIAYQRIKK